MEANIPLVKRVPLLPCPPTHRHPHHVWLSRECIHLCLFCVIVQLSIVGIACNAPHTGQPSSDEAQSVWLLGGKNSQNTRSQPSETTISTANVGNLAPKWAVVVAGDVSATPTTDGRTLYFPDWGGNLNALKAATGEVVWQTPVSRYNGVFSYSRTSPAIVDHGRALIIGDLAAFGNAPAGPGASIIKLDAQTGKPLWMTKVDSHPEAIITANPAVAQNIVIVGVASQEEVAADSADYPCCTFRGSVVALDERSGAILWKTYMVPENGGEPGGYSGGGVWGSTPAIDFKRGLVYVATGNNYTVPTSVAACQAALNLASCVDANDRIDAVVALDLLSGAIRWTFQPQFTDNSTDGCLTGVNCEQPHQNDSENDNDFAQAPMLVNASGRTIVFAGQKSGTGYALDPDTGALLWRKALNTGMMWGSATDGQRIYVASARPPAGWSAVDPVTGNTLWTTSDPTSPNAVGDIGPTSVANGVVYAGSTNSSGPNMFGMDATNGQILFSFASGSSVAGGPSIANGALYWGSGYSKARLTGNKMIFAFTLNGK